MFQLLRLYSLLRHNNTNKKPRISAGLLLLAKKGFDVTGDDLPFFF